MPKPSAPMSSIGRTGRRRTCPTRRRRWGGKPNRHCEERSDEAISSHRRRNNDSWRLLRFARNDEFWPIAYFLTRDSTPLPTRRSEEHTSELQSLMRTSYAVFCLKKKKQRQSITQET